jgi:membrane-associated phospholipid phosphatase
MTEAAARRIPTIRIARRLLTGDTGRWLVVAAVTVFDLIGFKVADIEVDWPSAEGSAELIAFFLVYAVAFDQVRRRSDRFPFVQRFAAFIADFGFSAVQLAVFALVSAPLTYILARADRPLIDLQLGAADRLLGFDWAGTQAWVTLHRPVYAVLRWTYFSHIAQSWTLLALGSLWYPGRRNGELIWSFMISLVICAAGSAVAPALSMGGDAAGYLPVMRSLRDGSPVLLAWDQMQGIVSFPSFHAALGTIFIYVARHRLWALIPFAILDTLLLISTPPIGGHYLTDVIGGICVALIAIALTRRLQPASLSASDSRLALPPAAVVSTEITRSTANRAR